MVRSIDLRYEQVRGTHRPNKVARLIGTRVAETILASGLTSCTNRPDIWTQAIRSNLTKLLCHGGRPHMAHRALEAQDTEACRSGACQQDGPHRLETDDNGGEVRERAA